MTGNYLFVKSMDEKAAEYAREVAPEIGQCSIYLVDLRDASWTMLKRWYLAE